MKKILFTILLLTSLNACSLPLVGSLTSSGITGAVTGEYQRSLVSGGVDILVHESTGKTPGQHLYAMIENKHTKEKLEKHFPDKSITWEGFAYDDFGLTPMAATYVAPTPTIH